MISLFIVLSLIYSVHCTPQLKEVAVDIDNFFNTQHPPQYNNRPLLQHHHSKRCTTIENREAIDRYLNGMFKSVSRDLEVLVSTPCLGTDSLGNNLGAYFENIVCANKTGMHYLAVAKIWEPSTKDASTPFFDMLPTMVEHNHPSDAATAKQKLADICKCAGSCHERQNAAWIKGLDIVKSVMNNALKHYMSVTPNLEHMIVSSNDVSNVAADTKLPLIPEAAIHYRCGDNFVGHYGFLPFSAITDNIPKTVKTLYVLAENRNRKTKINQHRASKCDAIFQSMFKYLTEHYPNTQIVIRRGDDLYVDMARLSYAKFTLCSVSTFCLWPAIVNPHKAFFPRTRLIVGGNTEINLGFTWLTKPAVVLGSQNEHQPTPNLIAKLNH